MVRGWVRAHLAPLGIGAVVTLCAVIVHVAGATRPLEGWFLDLCFRSFRTIEPSKSIVLVDIDDESLDRVGEWPWPRDLQADMLRVLADAKPAAIVLDFVHINPRPGEYRLAQLSAYADLEGTVETIGAPSAENIIFPDDELADAIRHAEPIFLSFFYQQQIDRSPLEQAILAALTQDVDGDFDAIAARLHVNDHQRKELPWFTLRRAAILARVQEELRREPTIDLHTVHERLTKARFEDQTPIGKDIKWAYLQAISLRSLVNRLPPIDPKLAGRVPEVAEIKPPLYRFVDGADGVGFVVFRAQQSQGILRELPILRQWDGRLMKQLSFAAYCSLYGVADEDLSLDASGDLRIAGTTDRAPMRIPLDRENRILINWHHADDNWLHSFTHVPAGKLVEVAQLRRQLRENDVRRWMYLGEIMRLVKDDRAFDGYRRAVAQYLADRRRLRRMQYDPTITETDAAAQQQRVDEQRKRIEADHAATVQFVTEIWTQLKDEDPKDPEIAGDYKRFAEAHRILTEKLPRLDDADAILRERQTQTLAQLRPLLAGKVCFVGYTATALADTVNTPVYPEMPGVMVHANLYNTLVQGAFLHFTNLPEQALIIAVIGLLVTWLSTRYGASTTLIAVIVVMAAFVLTHVLLFSQMHLWLSAITAVPTAFGVWAFVVVFRFLVTERDKRRVSKALAQYTSPAIARRIADQTERLDLSPTQRVVTCFFSDLANFTTLTERYLNPATTRSVLNPYLDAMSGVLNTHAALINKFMGDGIFAFFNPPIYACQTHPRNACLAALAAQDALTALIDRQRATPLGEVFTKLSMRIGVATGEVFVGDFGSENKLDYTCMGDTVNLAARLESANKAFGTRILIAEATREAAGDDLVFRRLGAVRVKGKQQATNIYELMGDRQTVSSEKQMFAERFSRAVDLFQARRWQEAEQAFEQCGSQTDGDIAIQRYRQTIAAYRTQPPPDDWVGALELTEK